MSLFWKIGCNEIVLSSKKKILIFIDWYLPGYRAGGPIRSCANLVAHLSKYYQFYIITRDTDYQEDEPYPSIDSDTWIEQRDEARVFYMSKEKLSYAFLKSVVNDLDYDAAYINGIYSKYFSILPLFVLKNQHKPIIVASRGMLANSAIGVKYLKKKLFLLVASLFNLYKNVIFHATNDSEGQDIKNAIGIENKIKIAPNLHKPIVSVGDRKIVKATGSLRLISIARISPEKNLKQLLEVLANTNEGNVHLDIYGAIYNTKYWEECKVVISNCSSNVKINYCGVLEPSQIEETIQHYHFLSLLSLGENFGHVILESFMARRPVIISDQTPWKGLSKDRLGWDLPLDNNDVIEKCISKAISMNQNDFDECIESSRNMAHKITTDKIIIEQSVDLFRNSGQLHNG